MHPSDTCWIPTKCQVVCLVSTIVHRNVLLLKEFTEVGQNTLFPSTPIIWPVSGYVVPNLLPISLPCVSIIKIGGPPIPGQDVIPCLQRALSKKAHLHDVYDFVPLNKLLFLPGASLSCCCDCTKPINLWRHDSSWGMGVVAGKGTIGKLRCTGSSLKWAQTCKDENWEAPKNGYLLMCLHIS